MRVNLISHTAGVGDLAGLTMGEILAFTARVSNPGNQMNHETAPKLLAYCLRKKHWSIFETCSITFEITTSMAIGEQMLRHRSATFQKFSMRYSEATDFETYEARRQDDKNRQNSIDDLDEETKSWFKRVQVAVQEICMAYYKQGLDKSIAKELMRFLLPASTTTTLYMTNNVRSWIHYIQSRTAEGVQKEHKDIAFEIKRILLELIPELSDILQ